MWVRFNELWQDGLYKYQVGMVVELPTTLAEGYCGSGKAKRCNPPKRIASVRGGKKGKTIPSAKRRIKRMSTNAPRQQSFSEIADNVFEDD